MYVYIYSATMWTNKESKMTADFIFTIKVDLNGHSRSFNGEVH